jgi:hypothetical protein
MIIYVAMAGLIGAPPLRRGISRQSPLKLAASRATRGGNAGIGSFVRQTHAELPASSIARSFALRASFDMKPERI